MEDLLTRKVTGAILGFKNNTKSVNDVQALINRLKGVNSLLAEDYEKKFVAAARERKEKQERQKLAA